jgi:hypothetical protein
MTAEDTRHTPTIPWYIWLAALAVTSAIVGIQWDISWHRSIGRDAFLTPAHIAIYLCGILAALFCGYLIFSATFADNSLRAASVKVWGLRGPLGAFVAAWGGFAMLTSAPFDDWWHGAYGLDVKILSPPHIVLALGIFAIQAGVVMLVAAQRNRADTVLRRAAFDWLFLYVGGMGLLLLMSVTLEYTGLLMQHNALFYQAMCITVPFVLAHFSAASGKRFAATAVAAIYTLFMMALVWILPLFRAEPKLGPVYHQVTHFVPAGFPLLLIVPALVLDLFWARFPAMNPWLKSLISGLLFLAVFAAVQWPFANFLQSSAARNAFFDSDDFDYMTGPTSMIARHLFVGTGGARAFWTGMAWAALWSVLGVRIGLERGKALREVKR